MPVWLTAPLIAIAVLMSIWWAESRLATVISELRAIRENLDRLRALAEEGDVVESVDVEVER